MSFFLCNFARKITILDLTAEDIKEILKESL